MPKWKISKDKDIVKTLMKISEKICEDLFFMQQSRFMAIMNNYDRTLQLVKVSTNSAGAAQQQYAIYADSVEAAQNKMNNSIEKFNANLLKQENVKAFYNIIGGLADVFGGIHPLITLVVTALAAYATKTFLLTGAIKLKTLAQAMANNEDLKSVNAMSEGAKKLYTFIARKQVDTKVTWGMVAAQTAYNAAITLGISLLITGVTWLISSWINRKNHVEVIKEEVAALNERAAASAQELNSFESLIARYKELNSIIDKTTSQQDELRTVTDQILEMSPNLLDSIDSERNKRLKNNEELDKELKKKREIALIDAQAASRKTISLYAGTQDYQNIESLTEGQKTRFEEMEKLKKDIMKYSGDSKEVQKVFKDLANGTIKTVTDFQVAISLAMKKSGEEFNDTKYFKMVYKNTEKSIEEWARIFEEAYGNQLPKTLENVLNNLSSSTRSFSNSDIIGQSFIEANASSNIKTLFETEMQKQAEEFFNSELVFLDDLINTQISDVQNKVTAEYALKGSQFMEQNKEVSDIFLSGIQEMTNYAVEQLKTDAGELGYIGEAAADHVTNNLDTMVRGMYDALVKFESNPEAVKNTETSKQVIKTLLESGASYETVMAEIDRQKALLTTGPNKTTEDVANLILSSVFDSKAVAEKIKNISEVSGIYTEEELAKYSQSTINMISEAMNGGNTDIVTTIKNAGDEQRKLIDKAYEDFLKDTKSAVGTSNFVQTLIDNLGVSEKVAKDYVSGYKSIGTGALENIKTLYEDINKTTDLLKKSMVGALDLKTAIDLMNTPGYEGAVSFGEGGEAVLNGIYLVNKAREDEAEIIKNIEEQINELGQMADSATGSNLDGLNRQIKAWENLKQSIIKTTLVEQGRIDNQDIISSISMINSATDSLKGYADMFQKIQTSEMSFLDIMEAVGQNPDLLFALEATKNGIKLNKDALLELASAKLFETKTFIKGEINKLTVLKNYLEAAISGNIEMMAANEEGAKAYLKQGASQVDLIKDIDSAEVEHTKAYLARVQQQIDADYQHYKLLQEKSGLVAKSKSQFAVEVGATVNAAEIESGVNILNSLAEKYSIDSKSANEIYAKALEKVNSQLNKLNGMYTELDTMKPADLFNEIGKAAGGTKKDFEQFNGEIEKFYNLMNRISELQTTAGTLDSLISLDKTGGREDIRLLEQKGKKLAELLAYQEALSKSRRNDLKKQQEEIKKYYSGYVTFVDDQMTVNESLINSLVITNDAQKTFYENMKKGIDEYKSSYEEFLSLEQELLDIKRQQEELYDSILETAIDTRQQLYDAIVGIDQKELEQVKEKFDQMTKMENDYLSAVKSSVEQQRKAREDASKQEDLIAKKRRLAILQRETSGLYGTEIATLQKEIAGMQQEARDIAVDKQLTALEEQMKVQQEQRDLQMQMLEEQQRAREETGYYWDRVDDAIQNGPAAMQDLLTSTQEYQQADPLSQQQQYEQIKSSTEYLAELVEKGIGINGNQHNIVGAITSAATEIANALGQKINAENISANANGGGGGGGGSNQTPTSPASSTPKQTVEQQYNQGTSTNLIKTLQTFLNNYLGAKLSVDGIAGDKTDSFMNGLWDNAIRQALNQGKTGFASIFQNAKSTKQISSTAKSALVSLYGSRYNMIPTVKYKEGGIVDFTGPAWVDGTSGSPEAFLNARQTAIFEGLRDYLTTPLGSNMLGSNNISNSTSIGDIIINLQNATGASARDIADQVKKELTNIMVTKNTLSIQKVR